MTEQHLVISFLNEASATVLQELTQFIAQGACEVERMRFAHLGQHQSGFMHIKGTWMALAKLEKQLEVLSRSQEGIFYVRTEAAVYKDPLVAYIVQVIGIYQPDTLHKVVQFFNTQELLINEIATTRYFTVHTQTPMLSIQSTVLVPADHSLAHLREAFILFCEENNLDAMFEPERN